MAFDPSLKKKKKKKKAFDLDAALAEDGSAAPAAPAGEEVAVAKPVKVKQASEENVPAFDEADADRAAEKAGRKAEALNMDDLDLDNLDSFGDKKKKKKKKRKGDVDGILDGADGAGAEGGDENQENQASKGGKEDGKTEKKSSTTGEAPGGISGNQQGGESGEGGSGDPWTGSDRDYTYDELLKRVFTIIQEKNPEMQARHTKGFVMRPPQVVRSGTKKTAFVNFMDIAKALHRQPKHLLAFLQAELGTVGTIDGSNQLILKGKFQQRNIETVLRKYIKEYVFCHTCRSPDTILNKADRIFFLQCMTCHSKCSVQSIKTGFQAVTGKRSAMRAKNE